VRDHNLIESLQVQSEVQALIDPSDKIRFTCGEANGHAFFSTESGIVFVKDCVAGSRFAFIETGDGNREIFWKSELFEDYVRTTNDGATVGKVDARDGNELESWFALYEDGIMETFQIFPVGGDIFYSFWTGNKPPSVLGARARVFIMKCRRV
jgi:hypothetical protein